MVGSARSDEVVLRVATFNPRHGAGALGLVWHRRLLDSCRSLDADVLALQEVDRHVVRSWFRDQPAAVARALGMQHVAARTKRTPVGGEQCNALCARGAFADVEVCELPRREGDERRIGLVARVALGGGRVTVACTHLQHRAGNAVGQLHAVLEVLERRPVPRLLAGDFNLEPPDVEPVLAAHGFRAVPSGATSPAHAPRRRIDYIAVDDAFSIVTSRIHQPLVGDHCPVVADLTLRG